MYDANKTKEQLIREVIELRQQLSELKREENQTRLIAILEATPDLVAMSDLQGRIFYLNRAGRKMLGIGENDDISNRMLSDFHPEWARALVLNEALPTATCEGSWSGETAYLSQDGQEIPVLQVFLAHKANNGAVEFISTVARDITKRKQFEAQLVYLADHDALTGLYNRRRFQEELTHQLVHAQRYNSYGAVLFLDLDRFKHVNDSFGHRAGDELVTSLASLLREGLREGDILARLGGDEFGILLLYVDKNQAQIVVERLLEAIRHHVIVIDKHPIGITVSIGIALFPEQGNTAEELLSRADFAMYQAKEQGRNCFRFYIPDKDLQTQMASRLNWEKRIREAFEKNLFRLYMQPILNLSNNKIYQYELLLRMVSDTGEILLPGAFLDIAERFGLIHAIDHWVVRQAIHLLAYYHRISQNLCLEVNLSNKFFVDSKLLSVIEQELVKTSLNPASLILEITETAALANINQVQKFVEALKSLGCQFALDDFGIGFSSFYYLKHLPVDYLKIDGNFIHNLLHDPVNQHLVKAIVEVAHGLGKRTIAEFVSDEETIQLLRKYGVSYAQGYHIGRPIPIFDTSRIRNPIDLL